MPKKTEPKMTNEEALSIPLCGGDCEMLNAASQTFIYQVGQIPSQLSPDAQALIIELRQLGRAGFSGKYQVRIPRQREPDLSDDLLRSYGWRNPYGGCGSHSRPLPGHAHR